MELKGIGAEQLIEAIRKRRVIWDADSDGYTKKTVRQKAWSIVIRQFVTNYDERSKPEQEEIVRAFQRRWKNLRTAYTREIALRKNINTTPGITKKKYIYLDQMTFLNKDKEENYCAMEQDETIKSETMNPETLFIEYPHNEKVSVRKKKPKDDQLIEILKDKVFSNETEGEQDEDKMFLLSLLSNLRSVPNSLKLEVKKKLLDVFIEAQQKADYYNFNTYS